MIINLETGELEEKQAPAEQLPDQRGSGSIIDLSSGDLIEKLDLSPKVSPEEIEKERRARIEALPEAHESGLLAGKDVAKLAKITPILLLTTDPNEFADIVATTFPEIGKTETPEGEILLTDNQTGVSTIVNKPGVSPMDFIQGAGIVSAFTLPGGAATIPARVGLAGAMEAGIQTAQEVSGGEFDAGDVVLATGLGAVGEVVGPVAQTLRQARGAKEIGAKTSELGEIAPAIRQAEEASAKTGVELFEAQKTLVQSKLEEQAFVGSLPAGSRKARAALLRQNEQAASAVDDLLDQISPATALETGPERFRAAAEKSLNALKATRKERASPMFNVAFEDRRVIDTASLSSLIKDRAADFPEGGEVAKSLAKVAKFLGGEKNLKQLHNAKLEIDQMVNKVGENSLGNTTKRELLEIKDDLLMIMDSSSPAYQQAREEFARLSPDVDVFQQSVLGKISAMKDDQLKTISRRVFDPAETNPQVISQAKQAIEKVDPQAWREIMRTELERRLGAVRADISGDITTIENIPGQLSRAIFGNDKQKRVLYQGSPADVAQNLRYLETALKRARLGRPGGSQTATREEIKRKLKPSVASAIGNFVTGGTARVAGAGEDIVFDRRVATLTKALYSTEWRSRMREIRNMPSTSEAASRAMFQLLSDIEQTEEQ